MYNQKVEVHVVLALEDLKLVTMKRCIKQSFNGFGSVRCFHLIDWIVEQRAYLITLLLDCKH